MGSGSEESSLGGFEPVSDRFYILATLPLTDRALVLKQGETFAVFDNYGNIRLTGYGEQGVFHNGTRFLSNLEMKLSDSKLLLLNSTVKEDNAVLTADLTNPDYSVIEGEMIPRGTLHIFRSKFLWQGVCYERIVVKNHGQNKVSVPLEIGLGADFADLFEVRGMSRDEKGQKMNTKVEAGKEIVFGYTGLDDVSRHTRVEFSPSPREISERGVQYDINIPAGGKTVIFLTISCEQDSSKPPVLDYEEALDQAKDSLRLQRERNSEIFTSNEQFNDWLNRSFSDLSMMVTETSEGPYPYAGVPWFSTAFGRDGIITALETLWTNPELGRGVLSYLASKQAEKNVPERDAEPGKILHETRKGEMAATGEIPFSRYYGSVDSTPLFILLAGAYFERSGDLSFIDSIWSNLEKALMWIDDYGDMDGDGFVEYAQRSEKGLDHQGWKDSKDSVFHSDGTLAEPPIALCEVQGYVYAAKQKAAGLASALGNEEKAEKLRHQAENLKDKFDKTFWDDKLSTYTLALDGDKNPCRVKASNAGHCLYTGIAKEKRAEPLAETLLSEEFFSGWGIRTLASTENRYNPISYHNGSIWPHDNALIGEGLARYGFKEKALKIMTGLFNASLFLDLHRLPELFCGFPRRNDEGPTLYPLACAPQSWAVASPFLLLKSCLGLHIDGVENQINFSYPILPEYLQEVNIRKLRVGKGVVNLDLERHRKDVGINVKRRNGEIEITVEK